MIIVLSIIVTAIIMIGSISLIYNAFAISVSERSRHLGMLSSVAATKKQKRNSVFFEGAIIGGKEVKTSKLTRKIFGIEGDLGLKNLKRNKARYRATVFSLIISMILFLAVSYFTSSLKKSLLLTQDEINFDVVVYFNDRDGVKQEEIINKIISLDNISEYNYILMKEFFLLHYRKQWEKYIQNGFQLLIMKSSIFLHFQLIK